MRLPIGSRILVALAALLIAAAHPVRSSCSDPQTFRSYQYGNFSNFSYIYTPGVAPYAAGTNTTVSADFRGTFWLIGAGDPAYGSGIDSGAFIAYPGYPPYESTWIVETLDPTSAFMTGDWAADGIDGCIDDAVGARCMAVLLNDQFEGNGYFALLTAEAETHGDYFFDQPNFGRVDLAPIPRPEIDGVIDDGVEIAISANVSGVPGGGLYLDGPVCDDDTVVGYKVYRQVAGPAAPEPTQRGRLDAVPPGSWRPALGGSLPGGEPIPIGSPASIRATNCVAGGTFYLSTVLVFDSGFETIYVSENSDPIDCGACNVADGDGDGAQIGACTRRIGYDCDDGSAAVFPGAPQPCDGLNNDCLHPDWPLLTETNEIDNDGDGVSECQGDPCPRDPFDDIDGDGFCGDVDNCPLTAGADQSDLDADGRGDACDPCPGDPADDLDQDGLCADVDPCPNDPGNDADGDGLCAGFDNCPLLHNDQSDVDNDGVGDRCDIFAERVSVSDVELGAFSVLAVDLDRSGTVDVVSTSTFNDRVAFLRNLDGSGENWVEVVVTDRADVALAVAAGDIDGDDDLDLAVAASVGEEHSHIAWYEDLLGDGRAWRFHSLPGSGTGGRDVQVVDLDNDGDLDILAAYHDQFSGGPDRFSWFENHAGDGTVFPERVIDSSAGGATSIFAADIDGDDDLDVVAASEYTDRLMWYENVNPIDAVIWIDHLISFEPDGVREISVEDMDGDGDPDILSASARDDTIAWYENSLAQLPAWTTHTVSTSVPGAHSVHAADLDGDGDVDVGAAARDSGELLWFENLDGSARAWRGRAVDRTLGFTRGINFGDLDGDGDLDALSASISGHVSSYENETVCSGADTDGDGSGDACDLCPNDALDDFDGDGLCGDIDNCPLTANTDQANADGDVPGNACDNCVFIVNDGQPDLDEDRIGDACDNCPLDRNAAQTNLDADGQGDLCDLDDGLIYITLDEPETVLWQEEAGFASWNSYRGDLSLLRSGGPYTQLPGSNPVAAASCGLTTPSSPDLLNLEPGEGAFFLISGIDEFDIETSLGTDSAGAARANTNPCP